MFTKALYYPWINIHNESWLKTAVLYWTKLHTIVPESLKSPYSTGSAKKLQDAGILEPIRVNSQMRELKDIVPEVLSYLETEEGFRVLMHGIQEGSSKRPEDQYRNLINRSGIIRIHPNKIHHVLLDNLERDLSYAKANQDGWLEIPRSFGNYYMTLLANKLSSTRGIAVVSDFQLYDQLTIRIRSGIVPQNHFLSCPECGMFIHEGEGMKARCHYCGERINRRNITSNRPSRRSYDGYAPQAEAIADGLLAHIVLGSISIRSDVPIDKIIAFREKHEDSLNSFRGALQELITNLHSSHNIETLEALKERLESIHINRIKPHIEMLRRTLKENFISTISGDLSISGMASILGLASGLASFPIIGQYALLAGVGISAVVVSRMYSKRKQELLDDPFSYVLSVESKLGYA